MKRLLTLLALILPCLAANAQLKPPTQTDTLYIQSVRYNYADIKPENWPCKVIYKSTTEFRIGETVLKIVGAREYVYNTKYGVTEILFELQDDEELVFFESGAESHVIVSGYEFTCSKHPLADDVSTAKAEEASTVTSTPTLTVTPNARLQGRNVLGTLPSPPIEGTTEGTVVVEILVDQYGNVQKATAGVEGTTLSDDTLWASCRKAAMEAHFNVSADAPKMQKGTITYSFLAK